MELLEDIIRLLADYGYVVLVVVYLGGDVMDVVSVVIILVTFFTNPSFNYSQDY